MERLKKVLIRHSFTIKQALKQMDAMGEKTLLVVNEDNGLLGTATDGDIRRWILKGKGLGESIAQVMNRNPIVLTKEFDRQKAKQIMVKQILECLPIINDKRQVISAVWWVDLFEARRKNIKALKLPAVIMAGGEGTRLHPFTKILPKPLIPIGDKPIIEVIINNFFEYGCNDFYLSLNYKSNIIKAYFSDFAHDYKITYIQENKPLGTAGSLHLLRNKINKTFFVSNCDIVIETDYSDIIRFHRQNKNRITLVSSMKNFFIPYGVCDINAGGRLRNMREKPEFDFLVSTGMYILEPSVLKDIPLNQFYDITDLIKDYLQKKEEIGVYPISEKSWIDIGQFEVLQETIKKFDVKL